MKFIIIVLMGLSLATAIHGLSRGEFIAALPLYALSASLFLTGVFLINLDCIATDVRRLADKFAPKEKQQEQAEKEPLPQEESAEAEKAERSRWS